MSDMSFGQAAGIGSIATLAILIPVAIIIGLILWPRIANSKVRDLIPDGPEGLIDDASERVRDGMVEISLPGDDELRFYGLLQRARELSGGQDEVIASLEAARTNYKVQ